MRALVLPALAAVALAGCGPEEVAVSRPSDGKAPIVNTPARLPAQPTSPNAGSPGIPPVANVPTPPAPSSPGTPQTNDTNWIKAADRICVRLARARGNPGQAAPIFSQLSRVTVPVDHIAPWVRFLQTQGTQITGTDPAAQQRGAQALKGLGFRKCGKV